MNVLKQNFCFVFLHLKLILENKKNCIIYYTFLEVPSVRTKAIITFIVRNLNNY